MHCRAIPAAPMRSARRKAAIARSSRGSARWPISAALCVPRRRSGWRLRSISQCNAPPTIHGCASIRNGSTFGPTARSNTPRTRPRNTKTSSMSISTTPDREGLWAALRDIVLFWVGEGVRIFRVDNPHTKPLPFWEWLIREVKARCPEAIFLAEAFTRPKMMRALAKTGFSQSYTYFTWRNTKAELTEYLTELTQFPAREYFRPNFFTNTPDILPVFLQEGGRPAFRIRLVLAATLSPAYGIYNGFELCENTPIAESRGIPQFREIRIQGLGLGPARQHQGRYPDRQPLSPLTIRRCRSLPTCVFCVATSPTSWPTRKYRRTGPMRSSSSSISTRTRRMKARSSCRWPRSACRRTAEFALEEAFTGNRRGLPRRAPALSPRPRNRTRH